MQKSINNKSKMGKVVMVLLTAVLLIGILTACDEIPQDENLEATGNIEGELADIITAIYENKNPELNVGTMEVDINDADALKYNTGLIGNEKIEEVAVSEAMIGSQAYSMVLVRLNDSADAKEVAEAMKAGIDQRKWICVEADDLRVVASGDVIMLIMVSTALSDAVTADEIVNAFTTVAGGNLSVDI